MGQSREHFDDRRSPTHRPSTYTSRRRRDSEPYDKVVEETVRVRKIHHKPEPERSHSHQSTKRRDSVAGNEYVRVYKSPRDGARVSDDRRPSAARRSTHAGEASKYQHVDRRELGRRDSERRSSHRAEDSRPALRTEKRSISEKLRRASVDRPPVTRSTSVRERPPPTFSRPPLVRSQTSTRQARSSPQVPPPTRYVYEKMERAPSIRSAGRPMSIIGSFLGSSRPPEPPRPKPPSSPEKRVECLTCMDTLRKSKTAHLPCGHNMCHNCLRRLFDLSLTDPQHMPPKCCTSKHIDLRHVEKLYDNRFKRRWNRKYQEYTTKNRIYCPARRCGSWIKPEDIRTDRSPGSANAGRKYGTCTRCRTKVCCTCNGKWHSSRECPKDPATLQFNKIAQEKGWQRCYNCNHMVELVQGCNHITCRCTAEFCMMCGSKWRTCDCPWFSYEAVEADRLIHMNVPGPPAQQQQQPPQANVAGFVRGDPARDPFAAAAAQQQQQQQRRATQERTDEELARRLGRLMQDGPPPPPPVAMEYGVGNGAGHFLNEDFRIRAGAVLSDRMHPAAQERAAERLVNEHRDGGGGVGGRVGGVGGGIGGVGGGVGGGGGNGYDYISPPLHAPPLHPHPPQPQPQPPAQQPRRASMLAGITRGQTAEGRVDEWRRYVE